MDNREIMIEEFSIETVEVGGFPIQTFKHRFKSIWEMFCQSVSDYGDQVFLIEGPNRLTFRETTIKVAFLAAYLREKVGVHKGDHVGMLMENSILFIIAFWAIQKLGATAVVFNIRLAAAELARQIQVFEPGLAEPGSRQDRHCRSSIPRLGPPGATPDRRFHGENLYPGSLVPTPRNREPVCPRTGQHPGHDPNDVLDAPP